MLSFSSKVTQSKQTWSCSSIQAIWFQTYIHTPHSITSTETNFQSEFKFRFSSESSLEDQVSWDPIFQNKLWKYWTSLSMYWHWELLKIVSIRYLLIITVTEMSGAPIKPRKGGNGYWGFPRANLMRSQKSKFILLPRSYYIYSYFPSIFHAVNISFLSS